MLHNGVKWENCPHAFLMFGCALPLPWTHTCLNTCTALLLGLRTETEEWTTSHTDQHHTSLWWKTHTSFNSFIPPDFQKYTQTHCYTGDLLHPHTSITFPQLVHLHTFLSTVHLPHTYALFCVLSTCSAAQICLSASAVWVVCHVYHTCVVLLPEFKQRLQPIIYK